MVPLKCLGLLLFTIVELNKLGKPCHCYIAGDGPERNYLEQTIAALGISEQVTLLGHIDDMASFYRQLDVYVCPSMHETGPLAALEAELMGYRPSPVMSMVYQRSYSMNAQDCA